MVTCVAWYTRISEQNLNILVTYATGTIVANTSSILSRWEQFSSNLLNVNQNTSHEGSEVYTAEPDIPEFLPKV